MPPCRASPCTWRQCLRHSQPRLRHRHLRLTLRNRPSRPGGSRASATATDAAVANAAWRRTPRLQRLVLLVGLFAHPLLQQSARRLKLLPHLYFELPALILVSSQSLFSSRPRLLLADQRYREWEWRITGADMMSERAKGR